jgi:hypothetical protein
MDFSARGNIFCTTGTLKKKYDSLMNKILVMVRLGGKKDLIYCWGRMEPKKMCEKNPGFLVSTTLW